MQLGIGASYASAHSVFPPGVINDTGPIKNLAYGYVAVIQALPYVGQQNTYNHFDLTRSVYDPVHETVAGIMIATLICPSNAHRGSITYAGCHNDVDAAISSDNHGVLYLNWGAPTTSSPMAGSTILLARSRAVARAWMGLWNAIHAAQYGLRSCGPNSFQGSSRASRHEMLLSRRSMHARGEGCMAGPSQVDFRASTQTEPTFSSATARWPCAGL